MKTVAQLKQLREKMIEDLTQIPEYRALKSMERFIAEMSNILSAGSTEEATTCKPAAQPAENKQEAESSSAASRKVTPYVPAHRVA